MICKDIQTTPMTVQIVKKGIITATKLIMSNKVTVWLYLRILHNKRIILEQIIEILNPTNQALKGYYLLCKPYSKISQYKEIIAVPVEK